MTYAYFTPFDLRTVDPRPAPSLDAEEAIVRELLASRLTGDDLHRALQALGLEDYERTLNPTGRDAWTRRTSAGRPSDGVNCRNGHPRSEHSVWTKQQQWRCRACDREQKKQYRVGKDIAA